MLVSCSLFLTAHLACQRLCRCGRSRTLPPSAGVPGGAPQSEGGWAAGAGWAVTGGQSSEGLGLDEGDNRVNS